jgi:hypothetical protein
MLKAKTHFDLGRTMSQSAFATMRHYSMFPPLGEGRMAKKTKKLSAVTWNTVRKLALALPGTEESTSYGTPAIKVKGKLFVRLREEQDVIVVRIEPSDRDMRIKTDSGAFFVTDHYVQFPYKLVRLSAVKPDDLAELLQDAWRLVAP